MSFLTSREQVAPQGIGKPVRRREDARLLTGGGRFADDMSLPGKPMSLSSGRRTRTHGSRASTPDRPSRCRASSRC